MNKQEIKSQTKAEISRMKNTILLTVAKFPEGWDMRHVRRAMKAYVEKTTLTPDELIKVIKRGYPCNPDDYRVDRDG